MLIKGSGLADGEMSATSTPLENTLAGASLVIGGEPASLLYADSGQVLGLVPLNVPVNGSQQVLVVRDNATANPVSVIIAPTHPAILTAAAGSGHGQGLVYNAGPGATTLANSANPAAAGSTIIIYCTGLGVTDSTGRATNPVTLTIGGQAAQVSYAGLASSSAYPPGGAPMLLGLVSGGLGGLYQVTATVPGGVVNGANAVIISSAGQTSQPGVTLAVSGGSSASSGVPAISTGGVVPVDSTIATIQPGEFVSIYGSNLGPSPGVSTGVFVTSLAGTSVTIDGISAYPIYVGPNLINVQAPNDSNTGPVSVVVTTPAGTSSSSTVTLAPFGPSFLLLGGTLHVAAIILRPNGSGAYGAGVNSYDILGPTGNSLGYPTVAAKAGDTVALFAVGLGPTNPTVSAGEIFSGAAPTTNAVTLSINNTSVPPSFAGLSGPGLYQLNLVVPAGLGTGDVPMVATVGGAQTQSGVVISLQ